MARILIVGCGQMAFGVIDYLQKTRWCSHLILADTNLEAIRALRKRVKKRLSVETCCLTKDHYELNKLVEQSDAVIAIIPWLGTKQLIYKCIAYQVPLISITRPEYSDINELATIATDSPIVVGCGLEPGLTEIMAYQFVQRYRNIQSLKIYCGGIVTPNNPPINYVRLFGRQVNLQPLNTYCLTNGNLISVPKFSGLETLYLSTHLELEAWHDGMLPWLPAILNQPGLQTVEQKTLRWPGFVESLTRLRALNDALKASDHQTNQFLHNLVTSMTQFDHSVHRDSVYLIIKGVSQSGTQHEIRLSSQYDEHNQLTGMAKMTGYVCAMATELVVKANFKGFVSPHHLFQRSNFEQLLTELKKSNVTIKGELL